MDSRIPLGTGDPIGFVAQVANLSPECVALLDEVDTPSAFVEHMAAGTFLSEAVGFLAHALPRREAIWWGWLCARDAAGDDPPADARGVLDATHAWIADPSDANRRRAYDVAEAIGFESPAALVALAAFMSGASIAPADQPAVPPGRFDGAQVLVGAIALAAVGAQPEDAESALRSFVGKGTAIGDRTGLWEPPEGGATVDGGNGR